jgi:truncated hemoglobin YjbI
MKKEESGRRLSLLGGSTRSLLSRSHHKEDTNNTNNTNKTSNHERRHVSRNNSLSKAFGDSKRSLHRSFSGLSNSTRSLTRSLSKCSLHSLSSKDEAAQTTPPQEPYLLDQLGGMIVLKSIVQEFGRRVIRDPLLQPLLSEADPRALHSHHERFFALAFTEIENVPQTAWLVQNSHRALFATKGLNEEHYDAFQQHLLDCLTDRGFEFAILDKVLTVLAPMRDVFKDAAEGKINSSSNHMTNTVEEEAGDLEQSFSLE